MKSCIQKKGLSCYQSWNKSIYLKPSLWTCIVLQSKPWYLICACQFLIINRPPPCGSLLWSITILFGFGNPVCFLSIQFIMCKAPKLTGLAKNVLDCQKWTVSPGQHRFPVVTISFLPERFPKWRHLKRGKISIGFKGCYTNALIKSF